MNTGRWSSRVVPLLPAFLALVPVVAGQEGQDLQRRESQMREGTVQSELDYLKAAQARISVDLKRVTLKQAYEEIAKKVEISIAYEGTVNGDAKRDVSFKDVPLKEILSTLAERYDLAYRVEAPAKLTVIGAKAS